MRLKTKYFRLAILAFITFIAIFARTYHLNTLPPSLFSDEVDAGYQALVFNKNGTDYFGNSFPVHFHSFADWRTSLNIYSIAFIQFFTHQPEIAVRLPSVIYGVIAVILIYAITQSPLAMLMMAVSPWAIHFSRTGFEVSGMIATILAGIYYWKKYLATSKAKHLYFSIFFFLLAPYFYSTAKVFILLIAILIFVIWYHRIKQLGFKRMVYLAVFGLIILSPLIIDTVNGKSGYRFSYISIFSEPHREQTTDKLRYEDIFTQHHDEIGVKTPLSSYLFHNKYELVVEKFISNYTSSFSTDFLIAKGDSNLRQGFGNAGEMYPIDLALVLVGVVYTFRQKKFDKISLLFGLVLILAPIPFALTRDSESPHSTRLILMLPSLIYFSSVGLSSILKSKKIIGYFLFGLYLVSALSFWHYYNFHYPQISAKSWHTGIKEVLIATQKYADQPVFYSSKFEPFLPFYLFYRNYPLPPHDSISQHLSQSHIPNFAGQVLDGHTYFGFIEWSSSMKMPANSIVVIPKSELLTVPPGKFETVTTIPANYIQQEEFIILKANDK